MRKFPLLILLAILIFSILPACDLSNDSDDYWEEYRDWREANNEWIAEQEVLTDDDGQLYYTKIIPSWNTAAYVLIHYFNDTMLTCGNLKPLSTSTIDMKYYGCLYDGTVFDSSYSYTDPADSVYREYMPNLISGMSIALQNMHVGDTVEAIVPYALGYGSSGYSSIYPYSHLVFGIKLVDIPGYEIRTEWD